MCPVKHSFAKYENLNSFHLCFITKRKENKENKADIISKERQIKDVNNF